MKIRKKNRATELKQQWRSQEFDWGGVYVLTSHGNFNVPHVNKPVTDFFGGVYTDIIIIIIIIIYTPVATPLLNSHRPGLY